MTYLVFFVFGVVFGIRTILWGALTANPWMVAWATAAVWFAARGIRHEATG